MNNLFIMAVKNKYRFNSLAGKLTIEDLWDLPLTGRAVTLDTIAKTVNKELQAATEESFVTTTTANIALENKLEIVKFVIGIKLEEAASRKEAVANRERKELLIDVLAEKEIDELKTMTTKEIRKQIKKVS